MTAELPDWYDEKADFVEVVEYDSTWPEKAAQLVSELQAHFTDDDNVIAYEHIGSTSVPGLAAKPIVDIYVGVQSIDTAKERMVRPIENMGFLYWADNPNPKKMMFIKGMPPFGERRTHHIHMVEYNSEYWRARLAFRDYLRSHPDAIIDYGTEKKRLASEHPFDREAYSEGKNVIVTDILNRAGFDGFKGR